jgi:uncharacterized protein YhfF
MTEHRMQWSDASLIDQIVDGRKTATVRPVDWQHGLDACNTPVHCGLVYSVHDKDGVLRCRIRITGIELCRWGAIPEALWRRDPSTTGAASLEAFMADHWEHFGQPSDDFEFLGIYFDHVGD